MKETLKAFKRKVFSYVIAYVSKYSLRMILSTCEVEIRGLEEFQKALRQKKCMLMLWHNRLSIVSEVLFKIDPHTIFSAVISNSKDGDPLAVLASSYKTGRAIRVPHNKKSQALKTMIDTLKNTSEVLIITPDGPRGPRYEVKPGIVLTAQEANASIIPFTWTATKFWQLKSWDRLIFPKPFSKIIVTLGQPIDLKSDSMPENQTLLKNTLLDIESEINNAMFDTEADFPL